MKIGSTVTLFVLNNDSLLLADLTSCRYILTISQRSFPQSEVSIIDSSISFLGALTATLSASVYSMDYVMLLFRAMCLFFFLYLSLSHS